jgi:phage shock protein PspC (stress-responsive transcriptional regulator)
LLAFFTGFGRIALVYLIMAIVVPEQHSIAEAIIRTSFST